MKTPSLILLSIIALMFMEGCATTERDVPRNTITSITTAATSYILRERVSDYDRKEVAGQAYAIALGVRSLSGGRAPTGLEVKDAILSFGGDKTRWAPAADAIRGVYEDFYKSTIEGAPDQAKIALAVLEAIAAGVEQGAAAIMEQEGEARNGGEVEGETDLARGENTPPNLPRRPIANPLPS